TARRSERAPAGRRRAERRSSHSGTRAGRAAPASPRPSQQMPRPLPHVDEATYAASMPEGDAIHRAARRLQVLVGQELEVETPHPRAAVKQLAPRLDGKRLEGVEAIGKNLLLHFEGGLVVRSHLRMKGRWRVFRRDTPIFGQPWLRVGEVSEAELRETLEEAHRLMRGRLDGVPGTRQVYRRRGRPCPRCGTAIRSWPQGDGARMAYWCPACQRGEEPKTA